MGKAELDILLSRMPEIADAVNAFTSEAIQREVFTALIAAYSGTSPSPASSSSASESEPTKSKATPEASVTSESQSDSGASQTAKQTKQRKPSNGGNSIGFRFNRDLDLRPEGKQSMADFVAEKAPSSNEDKYALAVYYLEHILEVSAVTPDLVGSVFRLVQGWREPTDVKAGLRVTSNRKGTIVTADMDNIRTTAQGRNFVEHDLPRPEKLKKSEKAAK